MPGFALFCCRLSLVLTLALGWACGQAAMAAEASFPFGHELMLDARPMSGSKRVPVLDIDDDGIVTLDLWCDSVEGQVVVANDTITILTGPKTDRPCSPEQAKGDDDMLAALAQVTNWRRDGDRVEFIGPTTLRFRIPTN